MKRHEEEPYTLEREGDPDLLGPTNTLGVRVGPVISLKDSVAAHQAECFCHRTDADGTAEFLACGSWQIAADSTGQPWHLDPFCKVRPEAKA